MDLARSTFYRRSRAEVDDTALVERIQAICAEFPRYGYRRVTAQLEADGLTVNHKRVARLMCLHGLQVRPKRRHVATTDSDHDGPIFPDLAKDMGKRPANAPRAVRRGLAPWPRASAHRGRPRRARGRSRRGRA